MRSGIHAQILGRGGISCKVIADSTNNVARITTVQLRYPRFIHSELMTHRVFSRNASSSRAIPVAKMLEQVRNDPAMPIHWGKNQAGMQASSEIEWPSIAQQLWRDAANKAADFADAMGGIKLHKQVANRILEPYQFINVIVTATWWDNFFELRCHEDAQPEIHELANCIRAAMAESYPDGLSPGQWHLPYITAAEMAVEPVSRLIPVSAARCARVSYNKHDGTASVFEEDFNLYQRLAGSAPMHYSPLEHQAYADNEELNMQLFYGNFHGWIQFRKLHEAHNDVLRTMAVTENTTMKA